jgi:hypothetical protein
VAGSDVGIKFVHWLFCNSGICKSASTRWMAELVVYVCIYFPLDLLLE